MLSTEIDYNTERESEELHLSETLENINNNIKNNTSLKIELNEKLKRASKNELNVLTNYIKSVEKAVENNVNSISSPYFAKIDYFDYIENKNCVLYIGKCGLEDISEKILTIDWRSPISSAYYDCQPGINVIKTYDGEELKLDLRLKRTFEIRNKKLIDFYDVNTISNDELLTKYLAKNKEAVLGEIVATIQQDQNEIIRESCSKNVIVQGGAGSGKTTVAMHRVSYLLYNYSDVFNTDNFYILGNNEMFLKYITSILPSLDVKDIKYSVISGFLIDFVNDYVPFKNGKNQYVSFADCYDESVLSLKGSIEYAKELDEFLIDYEKMSIPTKSIKLKNKSIMDKENILSLLNTFSYKSMQEKIVLLNNQFSKRLSIELDNLNVRNSEQIIAKYSSVFGQNKKKISILDIYKQFLLHIMEKSQEAKGVFDEDIISKIIIRIKKKQFDIFDIAFLAMIKKKICTSNIFDRVKHIVIDEAQDFGVSLFFALKNTFTKATFTIVGDVTQNINYNIGMNDWESMLENVFKEPRDKFYILTKSYRNTIEISEFANNILKKSSFKTYDIEPFIRHGKEVVINKAMGFDELVKICVDCVNNILKNGFKTVGIICRDDAQAENVRQILKDYLDLSDINKNEIFADGVMVMSVALSKGLEFDGVIIFDTNNINYTNSDSDIKLLYVAATRALHELYIIYDQQITNLMEK